MSCVVWGTSAVILESTGDYKILDSPRAGGKYWISGTAIAQLGSVDDRARILLTAWMCDQRHVGVDVPEVTSSVLETLKSRRLLPIVGRMTRGLEHIGSAITELGSYINLGEEVEASRMMAETECRSFKEVSQIALMLRDAGLIEGHFFSDGTCRVKPSVAGWQELERLTREQAEPFQACPLWKGQK